MCANLMLLKMARLRPESPLLPTTTRSTSWFLTSQHRLNLAGVSTLCEGTSSLIFYTPTHRRFV